MANPGIVCQCPAPCQIHPKQAMTGHVAEPNRPELVKTSSPIIEAADQLQLKKLEAESLKAQLRARDAGSMVQAADQQLQMFAAALYEKLGIKQEDWLLNLEKLTLQPRNPAQKG